MATKNNKQTDKKKVYSSLLQLKSELFPQMVEAERKEALKTDYKQIGVVLADESINRLISTAN